MTTAAVVLVHGAWHGAWCWRPVADARAGTAPAVLVGHSYRRCRHHRSRHPPRVEQLVYIAAFNLDEGESPVEWPTGHSPLLSHPDLVVDLLADLATTH